MLICSYVHQLTLGNYLPIINCKSHAISMLPFLPLNFSPLWLLIPRFRFIIGSYSFSAEPF